MRPEIISPGVFFFKQPCLTDLLRLTTGCRLMQSRWMSLVESVTNVIVGYGVAVVTQILIFPAFGLYTTLQQNLQMGAVFTLVSIARSFALRRLFNAVQHRRPIRRA